MSGLVEISIADGLGLFSGERSSVKGAAIRVDGNGKRVFDREIQVDDLIPRVDNYYLKVFIMAQLFMRGNKYLSI